MEPIFHEIGDWLVEFVHYPDDHTRAPWEAILRLSSYREHAHEISFQGQTREEVEALAVHCAKRNPKGPR